MVVGDVSVVDVTVGEIQDTCGEQRNKTTLRLLQLLILTFLNRQFLVDTIILAILSHSTQHDNDD